MRFGSLCSGIEGAAVALKPLGWNHVFTCEVDPFCCALLNHYYKDAPNLGDLTKVETTPAVDLVIAGTPCQSFSVQGKRRGMDDLNGQLAIKFSEILRTVRPRWVVWENVPGVMSTNDGRDFGSFLWSLGQLGYGVCYRILDARYFGVPQRRRRVFVVGHYGHWQRAAAVLFDSAACPKPTEAPDEIRSGEDALGESFNGSLLGWTGDETPKFGYEIVPTLRAAQGGEGVGIIGRKEFRRLSPNEWEACQGFPNGYTDILESSWSARKHAIGNAFCVPVIKWIGKRINEVENEFRQGT